MEQAMECHMKCCFHKEEYVTYLCIDLNCKESTRLLCGDCAIFIPYHKDHIHNIVKLKNIYSSTDGSSLNLLKNELFEQSTILPELGQTERRTVMSAEQVNMYFDLIEKQIEEEIRRVRKRVLSIVDMQDHVFKDIDTSIIDLESYITNIFEKVSFQSQNLLQKQSEESDNDIFSNNKNNEIYNKEGLKINNQSHNLFQNISSHSLTNLNSIEITQNNNLFTPDISNKNSTQNQQSLNSLNIQDKNNVFFSSKSQESIQTFSTMNNLWNECEISREISNKLSKIQENSQEQIIELELIMKQQLKKCEMNLIHFSQDISSFLSSYLPHKQMLEHNSLYQILDNKFGFEISNGQLQLLDPADFYQGMGYKHCIAVNSTANLPLLRRASTLICHQSADDEDKELNKSNTLNNQIETRRQYLFSLCFDNQQLNDINIIPISTEICRLSYIENIHLDFDGNTISSIGYQSLFNALKQFNAIKHLDLRFNNNYSLDEESAIILSDVLNNHSSTLRILCLTMRQLRQKKQIGSLPGLCISNSTPAHLYGQSPQQNNNQQLDSSQSSSTTSYSSSSTYFCSMEQTDKNPQLNSSISIIDGFNIVFEAIGNLSNLEVLYLDISHNNLEQIKGQEIFAPIYRLKKLEMIHFVFNKTYLPNEEILHIISNLNSNKQKQSLRYFKLFLKQNNYTFQQQRYMSGQFQKIKASVKNFDLFY